MKKNIIEVKLGLYFSLIGILTSFILSVFQFAIFDLEFLILRISNNANFSLETLSTISQYLLKNLYPLIIINIILAFPIIYFLIKHYKVKSEKTYRFSFDYIFFLISTSIFVYLLFVVPYLYVNFNSSVDQTTSLFSSTVYNAIFNQIIMSENALGKILLLILLYSVAARALWIFVYNIFLPIFFGKKLNNINTIIKSYLITEGPENFIESFTMQIANTARNKGAIGLIGFKIGNDIELADQIGYEGFREVIKQLSFIIEKSSRKGENQFLHQSNIILSVLIADNYGAKLAADRFKAVLDNAEIRYRNSVLNVNIAIGIGGIDFSEESHDKVSSDKLFDEIMWKTIDTTTRAQESNNIEIEYF